MKILYSSLLSLLILGGNAYAQNKNNFENIDKIAVKWKLLLNYQEIDFLPDIYVSGNDKYIPVELLKNLGGELILDRENKTAYITNNEESFILKEGSKNIYINNKSFLIHQSPIWKNDTLYISTQFLTKFGALISENKFKSELNIIKPFNKITTTEITSDNTEDKVVFNFTKLPIFTYENKKEYYRITFLGAIPEDFTKFKSDINSTKIFKKIDIDTKITGITILTFYYDEKLNIINSFILDEPYRIVLQIPKLYKYEEIENIKDILYTKTNIGDLQGGFSIKTLEVNPYIYNIRPMISTNKDSFFSLKETSKMAKDYGAIAAVNGGYFSLKTKYSLGIYYDKGKLFSQPLYNRSALLIDKDNKFSIKNMDLNIYLRLFYTENTSKLYKISSFNLPPFKEQSVLFSFDYGKDNLKKDLGDEFDTYLISNKGEVLKKVNNFETKLEDNTFFLYVSGTQRANLEKMLQGVKNYEIVFDYSEKLDKYNYVLGGGPTLIRDSKIDISSKQEQFKPDIAIGKAPRTALGLLKNDNILFLTVDGRAKNNRGFSLEELASYLKQYEINSAINFDGGGSTTMYFDGEIVNNFSDPRERKVSTVILVLPKK